MATPQINLSFAERQALQEFATYLHTHWRQEVLSAALFGSKARGDSHPGSDIDVLVITVHEDRHTRGEILRIAAQISLKYDLILSPRVIGKPRWEKMRSFSLYRNIQQEAIPLDALTGSFPTAS